MSEMKPRIIGRTYEVFGIYTVLTLAEINDLCKRAIEENVKPEFREKVSFEMQRFNLEYDPSEYTSFFMLYNDYETDEERLKREKLEQAAKVRQDAQDLAQFERLKKKFEPTSV